MQPEGAPETLEALTSAQIIKLKKEARAEGLHEVGGSLAFGGAPLFLIGMALNSVQGITAGIIFIGSGATAYYWDEVNAFFKKL